MALLARYIDSRTIASLASNGSTSFAHGLPAAPDFVTVNQNIAASTADANLPGFSADATNVSLFATGVVSNTVQVVSVVAHSVIR